MRKKRTLGITIGLLLFCWLLGPGLAQGIRKPFWAGQFYEADPARLNHTLEVFLQSAEVRPLPGNVIGLIVPHAGYIYSGRLAALAYRQVQDFNFESVVIIGPSHQFPFEGCSVYLRGGFETPLGIALVDENLAREIARASGFGFIPEAHQKEHSVEVQVPFIQKVFPEARIVPIVMGDQTERTVKVLADALTRALKGKKVLVIASTDLSHFLDRSRANEVDSRTIELIKNFELSTLMKKVERHENIMCGGGPVLAVLHYARKLGSSRVEVLGYSDSAAAGGPADRVVGYLAAAVCVETKEGPLKLNEEEKKELLALARLAVETYLDSGQLPEYHPQDESLKIPAGAFVTLKKDGELRGCIGFFEPVFPLWETVVRAAVLSATEDPRFPPLKKQELSRIKLEISVLGPLEPVSSVSEIQVGRHGLLIRESGRSGLLLPQVPVEQGWDRQTFLRELCRKAGLPDNAWRKSKGLYKFEALVFHE